MSTMFTRTAAPFAQAFDVVIAVVTLRVLATEQAVFAVGSSPVQIQHVIYEQHPHCFRDRN